MTFMFTEFTKYPNLKYGFSDRRDGSMNRRLEKENRNLYFRKIIAEPNRLITADLVHGARVERVMNEAGGTYISDTDALITNNKNLYLSATGADCFIVFFYDTKNSAIGIAHVGWRGLLAGVVKNTVSALVKNFHTSTQNLLVAIGPGIQVCHFEISAIDKDKFQDYPDFILEKGGKIFINLVGIIKTQLFDERVLDKNIENSDLCTYCNVQDYFSYRRDKPKHVESMIGYIALI